MLHQELEVQFVQVVLEICYQVELMEHGLLIKKLVLTAIHMVQIKWNSGPLQL